jgi:hypothetical protein
MAQAMILEFAGVGKADYDAVNGKLGIDTTRRDSDWPKGMVTHAAGPTEDGGWIVIEVWESQAAQGAFMETRLGPALHEAGLPAPVRVTWVDLVANTNAGG